MYQAQYRYGCRLSRKHVADLHYACAAAVPTQPVFSWRPQCAPSFNQGQHGSCTGQAGAGVIQLRRLLQGLPPLPTHPSQYFLYANARIVEGTLGSDEGASIRDLAMQAVVKGYCDDSVWSSTNDAHLLVKPSDAAYAAAKADAGSKFMWLGKTGPALIAQIKTALANKDPIMCGVTVYESFESAQVAKTGRIPMPHSWEAILGGHAIKLVGWNDHIQCIEFQNSWGQWGDHGFGWLPYSYFKNRRLASDIAVLDVVA